MTPKIQDKKLPAHKYTKAAIKPTLGKLVRVDQVPGIFQVAMRAPERSEWWLIPWDDEARQAPGLFQGHLRAHLFDMDEAR